MKQLLITIAAVVLVGCGPRMSIHEAAYEGNIEVVKQHLADGTDVNAKNDFGSTPLIAAARGCHKEIAELLIANDADVNLRSGMIIKTEDGDAGEQMAQKSMNNRTPLDMAILFDHTEIADLLRKHGGKTGEELDAAGN